MNTLIAFLTVTMLQPDLAPVVRQDLATQAPSADVQTLRATDQPWIPGSTRPLRMAELGVPFDSLLSEVRVTEGQTVKQGEIIAVLDDRVVRSDLRIAEHNARDTSAVERARAELERSETKLADVLQAMDADAANAGELTAARADLAIARADLLSAMQDLERARLELGRAQARLEQHLVRAPFDGTILRIHAEDGVVLSPGDTIAEIASLEHICVDLYVPTTAALDVREGETYAMEVGHPSGTVFPARVRYIEPRVDPTSQTQRIVFEFTDLEDRMRIGLLVRPHTRVEPSPPDVADADQ